MGVFVIFVFIAGKMGLVGKDNFMNHWELALIQCQHSNRVPVSTGSGCWMQWIWYGYNFFVCNILQPVMCGTVRWAEIRCVLVHGLCSTLSVMFSSSTTFCCTWRSARWFTLRKEPFSQRYWWTQVNTSRSGVRRRGYCCRYSTTAWCCCKTCTLNAYPFIFHWKTACLQLLLTVHFSQPEMIILFAISCTTGIVVITWIRPRLRASFTLQRLLITFASRTHVYTTFLTQNYSWN
jgi:hypothetical protein